MKISVSCQNLKAVLRNILELAVGPGTAVTWDFTTTAVSASWRRRMGS